MNIVFRCDASIQIGTGHVMRCLTLASALKECGVTCTFICREHMGHLGEKITAVGHKIFLLPKPSKAMPESTTQYEQWLGVSWQEDANQTIGVLTHPSLTVQNEPVDWLIVDHYGLAAKWEQQLRPHAKKVMVIDDLANREHDCDVLLDQNLGRDVSDYAVWVGPQTQLLIGPKYALLRPEFAQWRNFSLERRKQPGLKHILVTLGGVDKDNITSQVLETLAKASLPNDCKVTVVMGTTAPWLEKVRDTAKKQSYACEVLVGVNNMAELMANSDLAIGAAGSTSWERCCLGLPTITLVLADNQKTIANVLSQLNVAWTSANLAELELILRKLLLPQDGRETIIHMVNNMSHLMDAKGVLRVVNTLRSIP